MFRGRLEEKMQRRGPALRVSRAETRLTVYRPPYIPARRVMRKLCQLVGNPRRQRQSVVFATLMQILRKFN